MNRWLKRRKLSWLGADKPPSGSMSFNFSQGCNTSVYPDWGAEITRFQLVRRRARTSKDS